MEASPTAGSPPNPYPFARGEPPRIRFVAVRVSRGALGRCRAEVELEAVDGQHVCGSSDVEPSAAGDLRAAAAATLDALHQAAGPGHRFELRGVKSVRAFDSHVVLVQLDVRSDTVESGGQRHLRLMGSAFTDGDLMRATSLAVLNASNRVLWGVPGG